MAEVVIWNLKFPVTGLRTSALIWNLKFQIKGPQPLDLLKPCSSSKFQISTKVYVMEDHVRFPLNDCLVKPKACLLNATAYLFSIRFHFMPFICPIKFSFFFLICPSIDSVHTIFFCFQESSSFGWRLVKYYYVCTSFFLEYSPMYVCFSWIQLDLNSNKSKWNWFPTPIFK